MVDPEELGLTQFHQLEDIEIESSYSDVEYQDIRSLMKLSSIRLRSLGSFLVIKASNPIKESPKTLLKPNSEESGQGCLLGDSAWTSLIIILNHSYFSITVLNLSLLIVSYPFPSGWHFC